MGSNRFSAWFSAAVILVAIVLAPLPSSVAADVPPDDWFDVTLPDSSAPDPNVVASRLTTFDAFEAAHQLVAPADWKKAKAGGRVVVQPALTTFGARLVDCTRVQVVVEELALTAPAGQNATAKHPNLELIGRIGPKKAVEASFGMVFIADKGTGYHVAGGVNSGPANWDTEIHRVSGDTYRLTQPSRQTSGLPNRRAAPRSESTCSTRAVLPNTGLTTPRTLAPIGLALVLLGSWMVWAGREPRHLA
jgi:hypothetical protein